MVRFITSGWYTSVQDKGRFGYRSLGIPVSGAMDQGAMRLANKRIGNEEETSVLECTMQGPTMLFECDAVISISGAFLSPKINGAAIAIDQPIIVKQHEVLSLGTAQNGVYGYISVAGGWKMDAVLGSVSQYEGISRNARVKKGDVISILSSDSIRSATIDLGNVTSFSPHSILEVYPGPEFHRLNSKQQKALVETNFQVGGNSNRMAFTLEHDRSLSATEIITSPVQPGTVQMTPSGNVIVLMRDAQTTGGYSRILQLTERSMDILSQKRAKDTLQFKFCT